MGEEQGKYKGVGGPHARSGLGRLRRASGKRAGRVGPLESRVDDEDFLERLEPVAKATHSGESLLAKFNRLVEIAPPVENAAAHAGEICGFAGSQIQVRGADGVEIACEIRSALKKRIAGVRNPLAVGDRVRWTIESTGAPVIVAVAPRTNQLARADSHNRALWHVLAANVDVVVVVASLADPTLKPAFIDRYLVLAAACGVPARVALNKADLADPGPAAAIYRGVGIPVHATVGTVPNDPGVAELHAALAGRAVVFAGQSGVGKSSLVNVLYPGLGAKVGAVDAVGLGRHTTTAARSYLVAGGGRVVDTPGIRECGVAGLNALDVALLYPDLARYQGRCRFTDCTHTHEPGCAVIEAVERGEIAFSRYDSYCAIVRDDLALGT